MAKLYTRTGDEGQTSLFDGTRVPKNHPRVEAYGAVDELNAQLGLAVSLIDPVGDQAAVRDLQIRIMLVQNELFTLGAELATPHGGKSERLIPRLTDTVIQRLEHWIDDAVQPAPPLHGFILPGGHPLASQLHVCRTVCRRGERAVVALPAEAAGGPLNLIYLNRLGDLLFAWARWVNHLHGVEDVLWVKP